MSSERKTLMLIPITALPFKKQALNGTLDLPFFCCLTYDNVPMTSNGGGVHVE